MDMKDRVAAALAGSKDPEVWHPEASQMLELYRNRPSSRVDIAITRALINLDACRTIDKQECERTDEDIEMIKSLKLSELCDKTEKQRKEILDAFISQKEDPEETLERVDHRIIEYEAEAGMDTAEMLIDLSMNKIKETQFICEWLIWIKLKNGLENEKSTKMV